MSDALPLQEDEAHDRKPDRALLRRLVGYLGPYRLAVAASLLLLFTGAALELAGPYLTKVALDRALPGRDLGLLGWLVGAYVVSLVLAFA
ncbi:MAG TPA: hypothetical protein VLK84_05450, partial [Longimicrobium sp.]|nr:hypothetical protein [Longimicrobium sp.]